MSGKRLNILLAYVSYPVTTAVYFERALKQEHNVVTCGPVITEDLIKEWHLEKMKRPVTNQDLPAGPEADVIEIYNRALEKFDPDLYLWIESVPGHFPRNIKELNIPTACYLIDSHLNLDWHVDWALNFDHVFIAQREYVQAFKDYGNKNVHWLPLGCDVDVHKETPGEKKHEIGFVGGFTLNDRRKKLIDRLSRDIPVYYERCFWDDMAKVFSDSKIVFNNAVKQDLNMRVFEATSCGAMLLTDKASNSGQEEFFKTHEDIVVYDDVTITQTAKFYLDNNELREAIANRGKTIVHTAHTYKHRTDELLKVALGEKEETPSAEEWRERSLANVDHDAKDIGKLKRSFVIPVLDYSPASEFNIKTLLADLETIPGTVIVIFNNEDVANEIKNHPRIDYYAVMKKNVGVSRAWNVGMNMSSTPITFVMNADLKVGRSAIETLEDHLIKLPDAAIVGPQGSFFNFNSAQDLMYLDKGMANKIIEVDGVSGFFFAVKTELFNSGTLHFENGLTPCYFEEWDIGLQVKRAGLKNYVVPTTDYDHHWSGSIRALRTIKYLDKEETARDIWLRNRELFWSKWKKIYSEMPNANGFFESLWIPIALETVEKFLGEGDIEKADLLLREIDVRFPNNKLVLTNLGVVNAHKNKMEDAKQYLSKALEIDPEFKIAKENLEALSS